MIRQEHTAYFRNFDLHIDTAPSGGYEISVPASPAGKTPAPAPVPSPLESPDFLELLDPLRGRDRARLRRLGARLAEFLLPQGEVLNLYQRSLGIAQSEKFSLRLRLNILPAELAALPWEYAYDETAHEYFVLNPRFSVVRYQNVLLPPDSVTSLTPVPILLVVSSPRGAPPIEAAREVSGLVGALAPLLESGGARVDILFSGESREQQKIEVAIAGRQHVALLKGSASLEELRAALRRGYRILHFIGHGGVDPAAGGLLALADAEGLIAWVDAGTLARELRERMVAAVLLNTCWSASEDTARSFMGLAPSLVRAGIPAVVAMQDRITEASAQCFARELYRALADGAPLDSAVTDGRKAISARGGAEGWEWGVPVLFMQVQDGMLWEVDPQRRVVIDRMDALVQHTQTAADAAHGKASEAELLARGVGRYAERLRQLAGSGGSFGIGQPYRGLLAYRLGDAHLFFGREQASAALLDRMQQGPLTILHAESGAGKTSLLQAGIMSRLIAEGHLPVHVRPYNLNPALALKRTLLPELRNAPQLSALSLYDFLLQVTGLLGPGTRLYVLLDQFEEFFVELDKTGRDAFVSELAECVADPFLNVRWLLALRSEVFSSLASFEPAIRNPFGNSYRLDRLTRAEAEAVIAQPAARFGVAFEPALMTILLDDLDKEGVAPPQVQLVCQALYAERPPGSSLITRDLYDRLGGAKGILQDHLASVLRRDLPPEQRVAAHLLLEALISSDVRRVLRTRDELAAELAAHQVAPAALDAVLERLLESRLLRVQESGVAGEKIAYELAHDYLATQIEMSPEVRGRKTAEELLARELLSFKLHGTRLHPRALEVIGAHIDSIPRDQAADELLVRSAFETGVGLEQWLPRVPAGLARSTLLEGLQDADPLLRARAAGRLGLYLNDEVEAALVGRFTGDPALAVRVAAIATLAATAPDRARSLLLSALKHPDGDRRVEAIASLRSVLDFDAEIVQALFDVVTNDMDGRVWSTALSSLNTAGARPFVDDWRPLRRATAARQAEAYELLMEWRVPRSLAYHGRTLPALARQYLKSKWRENWGAFIGAGLAILVIAYLSLAFWRGWPPFPAQWQPVQGAPAAGLSSMAVTANLVYVGSFDYGVQRFDPNTLAWSGWLQTGLPDTSADPAAKPGAQVYQYQIQALAVDPDAPERVVALVSDHGLYHSDDAGGTWTTLQGGGLPTDKLKFDIVTLDVRGDLVLIAAGRAGLFASDDGGRTLRKLSGSAGLPDVEFNAARFGPGESVYAGGLEGLYRSTAGLAGGWERVDAPVTVRRIAFNEAGDIYLAVGWPQTTKALCLPHTGARGDEIDLNDAVITSITHAPLDASTFFVGTSQGVYRLTCSGDVTPLGQVSLVSGVSALGIATLDGQTVLLQANTRGLYWQAP